jgi:uncharacterized protein (TIGR02117 family)
VLLAAGGCAAAAPPSSSPAAIASRPVWVIGHGWHVGLALERADVARDVWPEAHAQSERRYVEVGWGDGEFYPAPHGTVAMALRAAFRSRSSVLHVAAFDPAVPDFFAGAPVVELRVTPAGFDALCTFVADTHARDVTRRGMVVAPGLYGAGAFYQARPRYGAFANSNQWAARALLAAGVPVSPGLSVTSGSVLAQVAPLGTVVRAEWPAPVR